MNSSKFIRLFRLLLLPFSFVYGMAMLIRNKMFDWKLKKSHEFDLPVISVGNITVGGTGKTPHVEYLLELLQDKYKVATLSRGYKRQTKGYVLADENCNPATIGDEPFQIHSKFPGVMVAVCESRVTGIKSIVEANKNINTIILDDAFQHRYVKPGMSILLVDYNRPIHRDFVFPAGNMRESFYARKRADIVIITKVPSHINTTQINRLKKQLHLTRHQKLFFSAFEYGNLIPVFSEAEHTNEVISLENLNKSVLLVTGIAEPAPLVNYFHKKEIPTNLLQFRDHHDFTDADIRKISNELEKIDGHNKIIITTEKDAVRIKHIQNIPYELIKKIYYIPVKVKILEGKQNEFENKIIEYVGKD